MKLYYLKMPDLEWLVWVLPVMLVRTKAPRLMSAGCLGWMVRLAALECTVG